MRKRETNRRRYRGSVQLDFQIGHFARGDGLDAQRVLVQGQTAHLPVVVGEFLVSRSKCVKCWCFLCVWGGSIHDYVCVTTPSLGANRHRGGRPGKDEKPNKSATRMQKNKGAVANNEQNTGKSMNYIHTNKKQNTAKRTKLL